MTDSLWLFANSTECFVPSGELFVRGSDDQEEEDDEQDDNDDRDDEEEEDLDNKEDGYSE
jgi:hypothetical protein